MKSVIYSIFHNNEDTNVHNDFVKFSKGVFENRYLVEGKRQKDKWSVKTSAEFANFFVRMCLGKVEERIAMKGAIICTFDLRDEINFEIERVKQFAGVKQHLVNSEVDPQEIIALMEKYPKAFYALTFSGTNFDLKVKAKPPKSGKPGKKNEEGPKADFCALKTVDKEIIDDLFFDFPDFKEMKVRHTIEVKDIQLPSGVEDPKEMREKAIRKGTIRRIVDVDGNTEERDSEFEA